MTITLNGTTGITTPDIDSSADISANGVTVGRGAGAVSTNTALGTQSLASNTTASYNTAVGYQAGYSNTTGAFHTALGFAALQSNNTGQENTALGANALQDNTTGSYNVAVGTALPNNTTASNNTAVGHQAGFSNTTGTKNTAIGKTAGYSATTGTDNTFVGNESGYLMTTGSKNTILGSYNGNQGGLDIRTSNNNIVLSDGDGNPRAYSNNIGQWFFPGVNGAIRVGGSGYTLNPANMVLGQYTSTRVYVQMPSSGQFEVWNPGTGAVATFYNNGNVNVSGALSKGSGSFRISHPLPELSETHDLVHSFIEGPTADLIYRGKVTLANGSAQINIDNASGMTEGTFVLLCREVQCFTTNESDWTAVRGSVSGNILTIEAQDPNNTSTISWMVIGERKDKHMFDTDWTNENGKVIVEPAKRPDKKPADNKGN